MNYEVHYLIFKLNIIILLALLIDFLIWEKQVKLSKIKNH